MKKILVILTLVGGSTVLHAKELYIATHAEKGWRYSVLEESIRRVDANAFSFVISLYDVAKSSTHRWPAVIDGCDQGGGRFINKANGDVDYWTMPSGDTGPILDTMAQKVCHIGAIKEHFGKQK